MSYVNKIISINGTEKDFIKAFANELTSVSYTHLTLPTNSLV